MNKYKLCYHLNVLGKKTLNIMFLIVRNVTNDNYGEVMFKGLTRIKDGVFILTVLKYLCNQNTDKAQGILKDMYSCSRLL